MALVQSTPTFTVTGAGPGWARSRAAAADGEEIEQNKIVLLRGRRSPYQTSDITPRSIRSCSSIMHGGMVTTHAWKSLHEQTRWNFP